MRINCPCCGPRDVGEFNLLGDAKPVRPAGMETSLTDMTDYVYFRDNVAGPYQELWYHGYGCRSWLAVTRDTRTHDITEVAFARDVARGRAMVETAS
jgi:sarcosine oxidase subunit delta